MAKRIPNDAANPKAGKQTVQPVMRPDASVVAAYPILTDFLTYDWQKIPLRHAYGIYATCLYANFADYVEIGADLAFNGGQ